jgi:hypothetical protein
VTFSFPENANHVLKEEPRPSAELNASDVFARYNAPNPAWTPRRSPSSSLGSRLTSSTHFSAVELLVNPTLAS